MLLAAILLLFSPVVGQFVIQYPLTANDINVCQEKSALHIRVDIATALTHHDTVMIDLPPGVNYVSGSVQKTAGTAGIDIIEAGGAPGSPRFAITPDTLIAGNFITFSILREADCAARLHALNGGISKDTVMVWGSAGSAVEDDPAINPYNIFYPSFSLMQPAATNNTVFRGTYSRSFTISNGAVGSARSVFFSIIYQNTGAALVSLVLAGYGPVTPHTINGDTLYFALTNDQLGIDSVFTNGESLIFTETFEVRKCDAVTHYNAGWGCGNWPADWCQTASGTAEVSMAISNPIIRVSNPQVIQRTNTCQDAIYSYTYTNQATESILGQHAAFNINPLLGINWGGAQSIAHTAAVGNIYRISINGNDVTFCINCDNGAGRSVTIDLLSDPDGINTGLDDLDGDGYYDDLSAGESFELTIYIQFECQTSTPSNHSGGTMKMSADYDNQCGGSMTSTPYQRYVQVFLPTVNNSPQSPLVLTGPVDLVDGQTITLGGCFSRHTYINYPNNYYDCVADSLLFAVKIPPGFTFIPGTGTFRGAVASTYFSNDTLFIVGGVGGNSNLSWNACYEAQFTLNCALYIDQPFLIELFYVCDGGCLCRESWGTASYTPNVHCPGPCPDGGLTTVLTMSRRTTMGFSDNTATTRQDPSAVPPFSLKRAMPCDTVLIEALGIQVGGLSGGVLQTWNNANLSIQYNRVSGANLLAFAGGTVRVYDASTGNTGSCLLPAPAITTTPVYHKAEYDISTCLLPSMLGVLEPGDSINIALLATVESNTAIEASHLISGMSIQHFNLVGGLPYSCDEWSSELYLNRLSTSIRSTSGGTTVSGCTPYIKTCGVGLGISTDYYPNEFRPDLYVDSILIETGITGAVIDTTYDHRFTTSGDAAIPGSGATTSLGIPLTRSYGYVWINPGNWPVADANSTGYYGLNFRLIPSCRSQDGEIRWRFRGKSRYYSNDSGCIGSHNLSTNGTDLFIKPALTLTDLTGSVQAFEPTHYWDIRLSNPTSLVCPNVWLALPAKAGITITGVTSMPGGIPLTPVAYGSGIWYQLTDLPAGGQHIIRITFQYSSCTQDSLRVLSGWDCAGFPPNPDVYACVPHELFLRFTPQPSEIEIIPVSFPPGTLNLCDPADYQYNINCSQAANTVDNIFNIFLPQGMYPTGDTVQAEYPAGAGNWESIPGTLAGSSYSFDLTTHSAYPAGTGLPGTLSGVSNEERQMGIRFRILTNCNFIAGSSFTLNTTAMRPCGQPAIGNNLIVQSPPVNITGVTANYLTVNSINAPQDIACSGSVLIQVQSTIIAGSTGTHGKAYIDLPLGMSYVTGSLGCGSSPYCPSFLGTSILPSGQQRIQLGIPAGVPASTTIIYSLEVHYAMHGHCGPNNIQIQTIDDFGSISCATEPSGFCQSLAVQTGSGSTNILIEMPDLSLSDFLVSASPGGSGGETVAFTITVTNSGLDMAAGQTAFVNIYSDLFINGSYDPGLDAFITAIPVQGLNTGGSKTVSNSAYVSGLLNTCRYIAVLDTGNVDYPSPCICTRDETASSGSPPLRNAGPDQSLCAGTFTQIGLSPVQGYIYSWSPTSNLSDPNSGQPGFSSLVPVSLEYILTTTRPGGCASTRDTLFITVLAAPAADFTSTNISCFNEGNGSITITASGGTPPYTYSIDNGVSYPYSGPSPFTISNLNPGLYHVRVRDANGCETNLCR